MAGGIDVGSISSLSEALSTLIGELQTVETTAQNVSAAGDEVVRALGTNTSTATQFSTMAQTLHSDEFKSAIQSLNNYITFLDNSFQALNEAQESMTSGTTTYATTNQE